MEVEQEVDRKQDAEAEAEAEVDLDKKTKQYVQLRATRTLGADAPLACLACFHFSTAKAKKEKPMTKSSIGRKKKCQRLT